MDDSAGQQQDTRVAIYGQVVASAAQGALRFWRAEAAMARLNVALLEFHSHAPAEPSDHPVLRNLAAIPYRSYDALAYVTNVSHIVYATTLLDTFLTDTTQFLLLCFPSAIGKNQQIPLSRLLAAKTRSDAISDAITQKAREVGFLSFEARVQYLRDTFGLTIRLNDSTDAALRHYPSLRNNAVHDQGIIEIRLDSDGRLTSRQKTCSLHPTVVTAEDIANAVNAYDHVLLAVARSVYAQVLKVAEHESLNGIERAMKSAAAVWARLR